MRPSREGDQMTKSMTDIADYVRDLQRRSKLTDIAAPLAKDIRRRMNECLSERQLIGVDYLNTFIYDPGVCGSHDYIDANGPVFEAIADYCEREIGVPRDLFLEQALVSDDTQPDDGVVIALMNLGWDQVKKEGFSRLWLATDDMDLRHDVGLMLLDTPASQGGSHVLVDEQKADVALARERLVGGDESLSDQSSKIIEGDLGGDETVSFLEAVKAARQTMPSI